ncbi:hypothetical protein Pla52o_49310 [Novipirellula galeiformis]|uniref:Uncharacterized protein n=1 Tax=Novipirellula galeiformis TaxID=2528004 RepID=A0A5C6C2J6_9BACT|nr:hypothetical protein Pla52o_49310 [Novipirellula galeiformis]
MNEHEETERTEGNRPTPPFPLFAPVQFRHAPLRTVRTERGAEHRHFDATTEPLTVLQRAQLRKRLPERWFY